MDRLTGQVLTYQRTGQGGSHLYDEIMRRVYAYPTRCLGLKEDDCGDFLLHFYPRIPFTIQRFRNRGRPFSSYLYSTLKFQIRDYVAARNRANLRRATADTAVICNTVFDPEEIAEQAPEYPLEREPRATFRTKLDEILKVLNSVPRTRVAGGATARRVVILAMKCCLTLTEHDLRELAFVTGYDHNELHNGWLELRAGMHLRIARIMVLQERRSAAYFTMQYLSVRLQQTQNPRVVSGLKRSLSAHRARYYNAHQRLRAVPLTPSNKEIAAALGIPKGSVDSTMHYLRRVLAIHASRSGGGPDAEQGAVAAPPPEPGAPPTALPARRPAYRRPAPPVPNTGGPSAGGPSAGGPRAGSAGAALQPAAHSI